MTNKGWSRLNQGRTKPEQALDQPGIADRCTAHQLFFERQREVLPFAAGSHFRNSTLPRDGISGTLLRRGRAFQEQPLPRDCAHKLVFGRNLGAKAVPEMPS